MKDGREGKGTKGWVENALAERQRLTPLRLQAHMHTCCGSRSQHLGKLNMGKKHRGRKPKDYGDSVDMRRIVRQS